MPQVNEFNWSFSYLIIFISLIIFLFSMNSIFHSSVKFSPILFKFDYKFF